jgi:hypothetical protein
MSNVMTALQPLLFSAAQVVSAEPVGCLDGCTKDFNDKGVAKGDKVIVPVSPPTTSLNDYTPAAYAPTGTSYTAGNVEVTITAAKNDSWYLTGEQLRSLENADSDKEWARQRILQAMRALRNAAAADCAVAIKQGASRAVGTSGTTPFVDSLSSWKDVWKEMKRNGAPFADMQLGLDINAYSNLFNLGVIQQANLAGSDEERRSGILQRQFGFMPRVDASIVSHTAGTGTSYAIDSTFGTDLRDYTLGLKSGSGTVLSGDVLNIVSDTNKYVCNVGNTTNGAITIGRPGLMTASADARAVTIEKVSSTYVPNVAFERSSTVAVLRPPIFPQNPTITQMPISDEFGLTYLFLDIAQYGQRSWELHLAWGFKVVQPEHVMILMG